jgi:tetratricopeptide (TPR) repeat protein
VLGAIFLLGGVHCFKISRRPTTNTKCALGLMCVMFMLGIAACLSAVVGWAAGSLVLTLVSGVAALLAIGLLVPALVLAIIGLIEYAQNKGRYSQGRAQAVWALVLCGLCGLLMVAGFISGFSRGLASRPAAGRPAQAFTNAALNYRFRPAPAPWVQWDVSKVNKEAQFGLLRQNPQVCLMLLGESFDRPGLLDNERLAELGGARLKSTMSEASETARRPRVVNGLAGLLVEYSVTSSGSDLCYLRWCCVTNGWAYQILGWGRLADQSLVRSEFGAALDCFEQIDPRRRPVSTLTFNVPFVSPRYHYQATVADAAWSKYTRKDADFPEAEFAATHVSGVSLAVVPVWLGEAKPSEEALVAGLLDALKIEYPDPGLANRRPWTQGQLTGVQYDYERLTASSKTTAYRLRCLQGGEFAYLVVAWGDGTVPGVDAQLDGALKRISFDSDLGNPAPGLTNLTRRELKTRSEVLNVAGIHAFKLRDYEKALSLFREAAGSCPEEPAYVLNAAQSWSHLEQPQAALDYLEARPEALRAKPELVAFQALFQAELGRTEEAFTNYSRLFAGGYRSDSHFTEYVNRLTEARRFDVARQEVERYLKARDSVTVRLLEAGILSAQGDYPQAIEVLQLQHEKATFNLQVANALAEALLGAKRYKEALELCTGLAKSSPDSAYPPFLKGRAELGLKWYREAKTSFEAALKLEPSSATARNYLNVVSGILGEGSNTGLKEPLAPVALPARLTNAIPAPAAGYASDHGAYYARRTTAIHFLPRQECRTTDYLALRVLDASGVAAFSTIQLGFDPLAEDIFVNELAVYDAAGNAVATGKVSDYYVLDDRHGADATHRKILNIPIAGLQPGCEVRLTVTRVEHGPAGEFPQFQFFFSRSIPVQESALFVSGEISGLKFGASPGVEEPSVAEGRCWVAKDPPVLELEPLQPPAATFLPALWVADRDARWPDLATNYLASIRDRLEPDAALQAQARALVAGLTNDSARLEAIVRHVQTNYTYKAIEFGRRARVPQKPADIAHNKFGDCKDHSLLLLHMLEAVGIPARLALVAPGGTVQRDYPSLDQFNHMIVYLPGFGGGRFVDCTDKGSDAASTVPYGLAQGEALILDGSDSRFVTLPPYPREVSSVDVQRHITFTTPDEATVQENITLKGLHAAFMRSFLAEIPPSSRRTALLHQFANDNRDASEFIVAGLERPGADLNISVHYPLKRLVHPVNDTFTGELPAGLESPYLETTSVAKRQSPFQIQIPLSFRTVVHITPPPEMGIELLSGSAPKLDPRFAECQSQSRMENRTLTLEVSGYQRTGKFAPQDYAAYRDTMLQVKGMVEREILLKHARP